MPSYRKKLRIPTRVVGYLLATIVTISTSILIPAHFLPVVAGDNLVTTRIDRYLQKARRDWQIPGLSVAIVEGDKTIYQRSLSDDKSLTPDTPFAIGSLSKSFTAVAVLQLVDRGKLALDEPVQRYLNDFEFASPNTANQLTLRNLLHHTSGLSMETDIQFLDTQDSDRDPQALEKHIRQLRSAKPAYPIGEFHYANTNYNILGLIVERTTGIPFSEYIEKNIFQPLKMDNSYTSQIAAKQAKVPLAKGYRFWFNKPVQTESTFGRQNIPSGYIISSARDMAKYLTFHLSEGKYDDRQLISSANFAKLHQPKIHAWGSGYYAMGWVKDRVADLDIEYHGGELVNFSSNMTIVPERKWGIVILANITPGVFGDPIRKLYVGLIHILNNREPPVLVNDLGAQLLVFGLPTILVIQIVEFILSLQRWRTGKLEKISPRWRTIRHIIYPLIFDTIVAVGFLFYLPKASKVSFHLMLFAQPDLAGVALFSGGIAIISICRTLGYIFMRRFRKV
jgi:CubicO group peptidase (beta-lactamase class C family)